MTLDAVIEGLAPTLRDAMGDAVSVLPEVTNDVRDEVGVLVAEVDVVPTA